MADIEKVLSKDAQRVYNLQRQVEERRRREAQQATKDIVDAIEGTKLDMSSIEKKLETLISATKDQKWLETKLSEVLQAIEKKQVQVNVPETKVEIPEITVPEPKVAVVETERVIEKEVLKDEVKVSNLGELAHLIETVLGKISQGEVVTELSDIIGKTGRKNAIPVNVVDSVVGGGGSIPFKDTAGEMGQHALVDTDGHQQVDVLTMPDITLETGDLEIGAVEIKDHDSDTRANVGTNGLEVDVKASALPTGASTSAKQDTAQTTLDNIKTNTDKLTSDPATATNQTTAKGVLDDIKTNTDNLTSDPATATNQTTAKGVLDDIKTNTDNISSDQATATNQATANSSLADIKTNTDNLTNDPATATNQTSLLTELEGKADLDEEQPVDLYAYEGNTPAWQRLRLDASTHTLQVIEYEHHEVHSGSHYYINDAVDLPINNVFDLQFTTADTTAWVHFTFSLLAESELEWYIYEGATIGNAGTAVTPVNNNRNSTNTSGATVASQLNTSVANANADTDVTSATEIAHGVIPAGNKNVGSDERSRELILKQGTIYCMRGIANAAGWLSFSAEWYEHTDKS